MVPYVLGWVLPRFQRIPASATSLLHSHGRFVLPNKMRACLLIVLVLGAASAARFPPDDILVLNLVPTPPQADLLAILVCCGLFNRASSNSSCYTVASSNDIDWLAIVAPSLPSPPPFTPIADFMRACFTSAAFDATIEFDYTQQQELVPNVITVAAALSAVPLAASSSFMPPSPRLLFNATALWPRGTTPLQATQYVYERWSNTSRSIAMMNPGYDVHGHPLALRPPLTKQPDLSLVDDIVKQEVFNVFLVDACVPGSDEHVFMQAMATSGPWEQPIAVWGYDDTCPIAGDIFEAETNCVPAHSMGQVRDCSTASALTRRRHSMFQVASVGAKNLAFFSASRPVVTPLLQPPALPFIYNSSKVYLSIIIGDGDNVGMVKTARFEWMKQRLQRCLPPASPCLPLLWTLSPHLAHAAPDVMRWFYAAAAATQRDFFVLPPSGHLYAYPGHMPSHLQSAFVAATEHDARIMNSSSTCAWEFFNTWAAALRDYFPRYNQNAVIKAAFATNVP